MFGRDTQHSSRAPQRLISAERTDATAVKISTYLEVPDSHSIEVSSDLKTWSTAADFGVTNQASIAVGVTNQQQQFFRLRFAR
jgi:hypothetical protein